MERPNIQTIVATTRTCAEFARAQVRREKIQIPRTSLSITAAILSAFPNLDPKNTLKNIGNISPLMIALNERADIGISARLREEEGKLTQRQLLGLILLENQTQKELEKRKNEFLQKNPQDKDVIEAVIEDFITLSRLRRKFSVEEWPKFLELDSAIFVCAFVHAANSQLLQSAGIDLLTPARTKEEIEEKYKIFITEDRAGLNPMQRRLRALFAAEMLLKVNDDSNDQKDLRIDKLLNLPSFARYAEIQNGRSKLLEEIKRRYAKEAKIIFPQLLQKLAELVCTTTSIFKAQKSKDGLHPLDDPTNFWRCFERGSQTTTLRHQLEAMCIISGLFSNTI